MTTSAAPQTTPAALPKDDYLTMVDLLTRFSYGANRLDELQRQINGTLLDAAFQMQTEFTLLQADQGTLEAELERLARLHPEWFSKKASLTTPVGVVKLTATSQLDVADEQLAVALLEKEFPLTADFYLKRETTLRKEALEALDDADLKKLKIKRVEGKSFKVTPAKVSLGDTVAKAKEERK